MIVRESVRGHKLDHERGIRVAQEGVAHKEVVGTDTWFPGSQCCLAEGVIERRSQIYDVCKIEWVDVEVLTAG